MTTTPQEALQKIETALNTVGDLCNGNKRWTMSVPVREDDPDIVIADALSSARAALSQQPVYFSVTVNGEHCGNFWPRREDAEAAARRLNASYPQDFRAVVPLYAAAPAKPAEQEKATSANSAPVQFDTADSSQQAPSTAAQEQKIYSRADVQKWRDDIAHAAAKMVEGALNDAGVGDFAWLADGIRALASSQSTAQERDAALVLAKFARTASGRLPGLVQDALEVIEALAHKGAQGDKA